MKITKKVISVLLSLMLVLGAVAVGGMSVSADDNGIAWNATDNRYEISSYEGLKAFADIVNGTSTVFSQNTSACAKLMNDIECKNSDGTAATDWTPIGNNDKQYTGTFDGEGHKITGLTFNNPQQNYAGLFGCVGEGGKVMNVGLEGGSVTGNIAVGGVVGENYGSVTNCCNTGDVTGNNYVGGVVGNNLGSVTDCFNTGDVSGNYEIGGVVGDNASGSSVENCYNTGGVSGKDYVGGVAGYNYGSVTNCCNTGAVTGSYEIGGVVGDNASGSSVENCYNTGEVYGSDFVGGVVGYNYGSVTNCYNTGNVTATAQYAIAGGVVGFNNETVTNCYYDKSVCRETGAVDGADDYTNNVTGLTTAQMTGSNAAYNMKGLFNNDGSSDDWYITAYYPRLIFKIENYDQLKAFSARVNNGDTGLCAKLMKDIECKYNPDDEGYAIDWTPIGNIDIDYAGIFDGDGHKITGLTYNNPEQKCAGLFGSVYGVKEGDEIVGGIVKNVGIEDGKITGSQFVGGVAGFNTGLITGCYFKGKVSGDTQIGGITGYNQTGTVENCYNTGEVSGSNTDTGGVVGDNFNGTVRNCFNTGEVSGNQYIGGVVGENFDNSKVSNCYNTGEISGSNCYGGIIGLNYNSAVSNSYTTGNINPGTGASDIGIIVGYCEGSNGGTTKVKNCYYDSDKITDIPEIGEKRGSVETSVAGLTTAQMTGDDALSDLNMKFVFESGETNPWLVKADGADEDGGIYYWFYPHLKGFNFNDDLTQMTGDEIEAADWPAKAEVSVTLSEYSYEYDGDPKIPSVTSVKIGGKTLEPDTDYTVSYYKSGTPAESPVNAGNYKAVVTFTDTGYAKGHTPIEKEFKITPKAVTVSAASEEFTYDGTAHSNDGYEVRGLVGSDAITAVVTGSITYPSDSPVPNVLESYEFTSGSAGNYNVTTVNGELTMSKASVAITITSASCDWIYDGNAHSNNTVKVTSGELLTGDTLVATATGSVTNVSDTAEGNNIIADGYKIMHGDKDVTENYAITPVNGTLTINPAKVTVTITGMHNSAPYDGEEHIVSDFNAEPSDPLYRCTGEVLDFNFTGTAKARRTDAGTTYMGLTDSQFVNKNANFDVTFDVTDGYQTIVPISVDVTVKGNSASEDYDGSEKSATGYTVTASNSLYDVDSDIEFSGTAEAKRTEPGNESMGLDSSQFSNKNANFNATFTVEEDGKLTVNPIIKFVNEDGTELQSGAVAYGETPEYTGETPVKTANDGYAYEFAAWTPVITAATDNATYTATYTKTAIEYTATFVDEKGETVAEVPYTVESGSIEAPAVPGKDGYNGEWEDYELTPGGITVKPVYTPADICPLDNEYHGDNFWGRLVKFFHTVIWKAFNLVGINIYLKIW